jgi:hypothetical protein
MRTLVIIQGSWAFLLFLLDIYFWFVDVFPGAALLILVVLYGFAILDLSRSKRWAWWACCVPSILVLLLIAPTVLFNFYLFIIGDDLYLDSPGTILVVAVITILFVFPALTGLVALLMARKRFAYT